MVYLGYTIVYILCKRGLVESRHPFREAKTCVFSRLLVCAPTVVCTSALHILRTRMYIERKKKALLEVMLFIGVSIVNQ